MAPEQFNAQIYDVSWENYVSKRNDFKDYYGEKQYNENNLDEKYLDEKHFDKDYFHENFEDEEQFNSNPYNGSQYDEEQFNKKFYNEKFDDGNSYTKDAFDKKPEALFENKKSQFEFKEKIDKVHQLNALNTLNKFDFNEDIYDDTDYDYIDYSNDKMFSTVDKEKFDESTSHHTASNILNTSKFSNNEILDKNCSCKCRCCSNPKKIDIMDNISTNEVMQNNIYAHYCSLEKRDRINGECVLNLTSVSKSSPSPSEFLEDVIILKSDGRFKISYGIVCAKCEKGEMEILLNDESIPESIISNLNGRGVNNSFVLLDAREGDRLALKVRGKNITLSETGMNAFIMIEKMSGIVN